MYNKDTHSQIAKALASKIGDANVFNRSEEFQPSIEVAPEKLKETILFLKEGDFKADLLDSISALDLLEYKNPELDRAGVPWASFYKTVKDDAGKESAERCFMLVYHLFSFTKKESLIIKTVVAAANPVIDTIDTIYGNANWLEREQFDLLGIDFKGSKDLRRLMLPEDWKGHPLRKDYVEAASYQDMPTSRPNPLARFTDLGKKLKEEAGA